MRNSGFPFSCFQHHCWHSISLHQWGMQHTLERWWKEVSKIESRSPLGRWRGSLVEGRRHEQWSLMTHHILTAAHFASTGPGMGLIAHFPNMIPGILPSLHICRSWPVPLQRRNQEEGKRWTGELSPAPPCCHHKHLGCLCLTLVSS